jgi:hypothetical protein
MGTVVKVDKPRILARTVVSLVSFALLFSGCATEKKLILPPGQNQDELVSTIAKEGRGDVPPNLEPDPDPGLAGAVARACVLAPCYSMVACAYCLYVVARIAYICKGGGGGAT